MSTDAKRIALDVMDWMWGTVQGAFNEKMDLSQIITDAIIGMIPLVGDVTAARDLIAISLGLAGDEHKRQDKMQWMLLVIFVFALIPVFGGVVKGVGRLALNVTEDIARNTKVLEEVIAFLNRIGHGNAVKWLKELDVLKYQAEVLGKFNALMDTLVKATERIRVKLGPVLTDSLLLRLKAWGEGFKKVKEAGSKMIPEGLKELHARLLRLQQLVYRGEWHAVTPGMRNVTREAEARLVEDGAVVAERSAHGGWKQNPASEADKAKIATVYKWQEGYPDLLDKIEDTALEKKVFVKIAAFSGPVKASKVKGGEYILRIHTAIPKTAAGAWWVRLPPGVTEANWREVLKNGKQWREVLAVLEEFSMNGAFSICRVKPGHSINAWEGRAAEQFGMQNPGQYLPGGMVQLYTEAWSKSFDDSVEWLVRGGATGWTDLLGIGYAAGNVKLAGAARVQRLDQNEEQSKRPAAAGAHR
jgi:hypothetical protein